MPRSTSDLSPVPVLPLMIYPGYNPLCFRWNRIKSCNDNGSSLKMRTLRTTAIVEDCKVITHTDCFVLVDNHAATTGAFIRRHLCVRLFLLPSDSLIISHHLMLRLDNIRCFSVGVWETANSALIIIIFFFFFFFFFFLFFFFFFIFFFSFYYYYYYFFFFFFFFFLFLQIGSRESSDSKK